MKKLTALFLTFPLVGSVSSVLDANAEDTYGKCIDVSWFQQYIDWEAVKADGVDYAIIRCAYTNLSNIDYSTDEFFFANYEGAKNAGIKVGAYIYTVASTIPEMESNVNDMLDTINGLDFDLPVYLDIECEIMQGDLSQRELTDVILHGCTLIENAGYNAGVYANLNWMNNHFYSSEIRDAGFSLWGAAYPYGSYAADPYEYDYSQFDIWQYSNCGIVSGLPGYVDVDFIYRIPEKLNAEEDIIIPEEPKKEELSVECSELTLNVGTKAEIHANLSDLVYSSDNEDIAIVSKNGIVYGVSKGNAVITVTAPNGESVNINVTVTDVVYGDSNCDTEINMADAVLIMQSLANPSKYGINGTDTYHITEQGILNGDMDGNGLTNADALEIQKTILKIS